MDNVSLTTLDFLKQFLRTRGGDTTYDTRFASLLQTATSMLENYSRYYFEARVYQERFDTANTLQLDLGYMVNTPQDPTQEFFLTGFRPDPAHPLQAMTVTYYPNAILDSFTAVNFVLGTDYTYDVDRKSIVVTTVTRPGKKRLWVKYGGGFTSITDPAESDGSSVGLIYQNVPIDLQMACCIQALFMFEKTYAGGIGQTQPSDGKQNRYEKYSNRDLLADDAVSLMTRFQRIMTGRR